MCARCLGTRVMPKRTICIFASSAPSTPSKYLECAHRLGELVAEHGHLNVNGGGVVRCTAHALAHFLPGLNSRAVRGRRMDAWEH
jgi:hypothetical protein